mmetsp:Transcript_5035/g.14710  ORF Transcript_5035/g.14710 Transcript_5035/m.14710 type:complete len:85 (-) Transcript_5035:299-553(-)
MLKLYYKQRRRRIEEEVRKRHDIPPLPSHPQPPVNNCMVRFENVPVRLTHFEMLMKLSRYDLTTERPAITEWECADLGEPRRRP